MIPIHFTRARLRTGPGASSLAAFLASASGRIGHGHHLVWSLFGNCDGNRPFVYRVCRDRGAAVPDSYLLYSTVAPEDRHNLWDLERRTFGLPDALRAGDRVLWSIRVNPVVKSDGKKHDVVGRALREWQAAYPNASPEERPRVDDLARTMVPRWLAPRLEQRGLLAAPDVMTVECHRRERFLKSPNEIKAPREPVVISMSDVAGLGEITDPAALREALSTGIGGAGAYGCGMLLLRRA